jgi:4-hydroxybenzoate polyprenyltransferase
MKLLPGNNIKDFLRLIRMPNLLIVALTMILMRYSVIRPLLNSLPVELKEAPYLLTRMTFQLGWFDFMILVLSTVCITAGGYVINDYFDIRTDLINRGKVIVGNTIPRRVAMLYHNIFNFMGVAGGFYVSAKIGYFWLGTLFLLVSGLLYFYSATYKRQFLIGNIIVALLTAMVPFIVVLFDAPPVYRLYSASTISFPGVAMLFYWVGGFALFAFMTTLIREIIKDIEDYEGDLTFGRKTLPVVSGIFATRITVIVLSVITIFLLYSIWFRHLSDIATLAYITLFIFAPFIWVMIKVIISKTREDLHRASRIMKVIMLAGILYSVVAGAIISYGKIL